jgi:hypothetical protein
MNYVSEANHKKRNLKSPKMKKVYGDEKTHRAHGIPSHVNRHHLAPPFITSGARTGT